MHSYLLFSSKCGSNNCALKNPHPYTYCGHVSLPLGLPMPVPPPSGPSPSVSAALAAAKARIETQMSQGSCMISYKDSRTPAGHVSEAVVCSFTERQPNWPNGCAFKREERADRSANHCAEDSIILTLYRLCHFEWQFSRS